jgi:hypothetical protein
VQLEIKESQSLTNLCILQVSIEGKEAFAFDPLDNSRRISNSAKFYQSDSHVIASYPAGLVAGRYSLPFSIEVRDDKRPGSFSL